jgi:hypothetical protein
MSYDSSVMTSLQDSTSHRGDSPARTVEVSWLVAFNSFMRWTTSSLLNLRRLRVNHKQTPPSRKTWTEKWKEVEADLQQADCKGLLQLLFYHFVRLSVVLALIGSVVVLGTGTFFRTDGVCLPNGDFALYNNTYNPWAPSGFFQITMGFGTLPFSNAKIIDIVWDVVSDR